MFKVKFVGDTPAEYIPLDEYVNLRFDPRLSPRLRIRPSENSATTRLYEVVGNRGISDIVADDPDASTIVVYLKEVR
jgi:hypothetical protein